MDNIVNYRTNYLYK